ncbi:lipase [Tamlana sp. 2_MG-2023]|uniref:lipase n=1 Tax=unclassified Tamlana TaxID=2614803 RepID=UPI0026E1F006|nr:MULTISPECIES: lipase [unclassified Tamlana]MDO6761495.1 lipase [Tamlana sp. 2_MG-2023]MDO6792330.1 lipase [Tamlana sp. 1_MG-2023]
MKYTPLKISLYLIIVLLILLGMTFFSDSKPLPNGTFQEGFFIGDVTIKYPKSESFLQTKAPEATQVTVLDSIVTNVETIIENTEIENDVAEIEELPPPPDFRKIDTSKVQRIQYPENKSEYLEKLRNSLNASQCRIIHYGDSQLEGDRISAYLRNRLQGIYGGHGPGFVPIVQVYEQISNDVAASDNWTRHAYFDKRATPFEHKKYGAYSSLSRFTQAYDSINDVLLDTLQVTKGTIYISQPTRSYNRLKKFTKIGLHYGQSVTPTTIKVFNNGELIQSDALINDGEYHKYQINLAVTPTSLKIELESKISPDFYGLTLDGDQGINLDNVAMRGSAGTIFAGTNSTNFKKMYKALDPKLVIFQYGGNSVPYFEDSLHVKRYAGYIKNHVNWVKRKTNDANILFIGPSDMSTTENGQMVTYPLLPYLNECLEDIMTKNGAAYWSIYDAMGGKNSMPYWVDQKLAGNDYTHFSPSGTKVISEILFLSLYLDLTDKK